jgi:hypothetical protein
VFDDGDNVEGGFIGEDDTFYGIGLAGILEEGEEAFVEIYDIVGSDIFEYIQWDEILEELDKELVLVKDELEAVVFRVIDSHRNTAVNRD